MRAALLVVAACSAPATPPIANATAAKPRASDEVVTARWSLLASVGDVTVTLEVGDRQVKLGTFYGGVYPAWQSYCDKKMGYLPARNVEFAKAHGALSKLTIINGSPDMNEPAPAGATIFLLKRPVPGVLELWELGASKPRASLPIAPTARVDEDFDDSDDRPGFQCGGDDGMNF